MVVTTASASVLDSPLLTPAGEPTDLRAAAAGHGLVVYFLRTFDCPLCRAHVRQLIAARARFDAGGARVVIVGPGTPEEAAAYREELGSPYPVLADPTGAAYAGGSFGRGLAGIQRSGVLALDAAGREVFAHRTTLPIHAPDLDRLIAAVAEDGHGR
jgi:peroxiredoxin